MPDHHRPSPGPAWQRRWVSRWLALCATLGAAHAAALTPLDEVDRPDGAWRRVGLPKQTIAPTGFGVVEIDARRALRIAADDSYGYLVHALGPADGTPRWLGWRWRVDRFNPAVDLRSRTGDDAAVKLCVGFDLPLAAVPFFERQLLRLARMLSGEPLPTATLCYVWDPQLPAGTLLDNAYSRRLRMIVLQGRGQPAQAWRSERRDLAADFVRAFGDETTVVPALTAIAVGADADNTHGRSLAFIADLRLE